MVRPVLRPLYFMLVIPLVIQTPFVAPPLNCSATPFCSPFPEPSSTTSMNIPQATLKPVRKVRSLFFCTVLKISCHLSSSNILFPGSLFLILYDLRDHSIGDAYGLLCAQSNIVLMSDDHHGDPCAVYILKNIHHFEGGDGIEGAGGFIGQNDLRF